jgi:hypothetical protein
MTNDGISLYGNFVYQNIQFQIALDLSPAKLSNTQITSLVLPFLIVSGSLKLLLLSHFSFKALFCYLILTYCLVVLSVSEVEFVRRSLSQLSMINFLFSLFPNSHCFHSLGESLFGFLNSVVLVLSLPLRLLLKL